MEYAWEDVKALFNGGSRKRLGSGDLSMDQPVEKQRCLSANERTTPPTLPQQNIVPLHTHLNFRLPTSSGFPLGMNQLTMYVYFL